MQSLFISFILTFTSLLSSAHAAGWTLDPVSCKDEKLQQQMRESMTWVFKQANDAFAELNKNPINQDVQNVFNLIWPSDTNPGDEQSTQSRVKRAFKAVTELSQEQPKNIYDMTTAIIYCNLDRLTPDKKKPNDYYRDSDLGGIAVPTKIAKPDGTFDDLKKLIDAVKSSNPWKGGDEARAKAFTLNVPDDEHAQYASQITIAPWYRDLCLNGKFDQSKGFKLKIAINKWKDNKQKWLNRQIDEYADFKVTLFHEMMHTRHVANAINLEGKPLTDDDIGYGWNKIINGRRDATPEKTVLNADNYAYFALVISFMKDTETPQTIDKQGELNRLDQAVRKLVRKLIEWVA